MKKNKTKKSILATVLALTLLMTSVITVEFCTLPKAEPEGVVNRQSNIFNNTQIAKDTKAVKSAKVKKPGQVKGLKKVSISTKYYKKEKNILNCQAICSAKIKFSKVKGVTGYQVLLYRDFKHFGLTPLVYAFNTKKTTYTIKNLVPNLRYIIKVRAYTKGKDGKIVYGKTKSLKIKTGGKEKGCYFVCNTCGACMPGNGYLLAKHGNDVDKIHKELHAGYTFYVK